MPRFTEVRERGRRLQALRKRLADDARAAARDIRHMRTERARIRGLMEDRQRLLTRAEAELRALVREDEQRLARLAAAKRARSSRLSGRRPDRPVLCPFVEPGPRE